MNDLIGRVVANRYRIDERIGDGAMGVVFRARHIRLGRSFAIKVLHPQLLTNDKVRRRFEREAEVAATLRHDNVIGVVDVGEMADAGLRYLVMDFAEGDTLSAAIAQGPMATSRVIAIAQQLCDGLQHAHEQGLIHRDFKPDNIIVQRDAGGTETPRIVDFGIALHDVPAAERERLTTAGIVLGTPHYMAPEHASGKPVDHRIDLFALGVTCYEMMTGRLPFDGDGVEVARANMMFDPPPMKTLVPHHDFDPILEAFTRKLMARSLDVRIPTAKAARELLDLVERDRDAAAVRLGLEILAPAPPPAPRPVMAIPVLATPRVRAPNSTQPSSATTTVIDDQLTDKVIVPETMKTRVVGKPIQWRHVVAATIAVLVIVVGAIALRGKPIPMPTPTAAVATIAPAQPDVATPPPAPAPTPPAPPVVVVEPPIEPARVPAKPPAKPQITAKPAKPLPPIAQPIPPTVIAPPDLTPSAAELAQFYASVGRKLHYLERNFGQPVTLELWPRYRRIRIQALLANPDDRKTATATLRALDRDIDAVMRGGGP